MLELTPFPENPNGNGTGKVTKTRYIAASRALPHDDDAEISVLGAMLFGELAATEEAVTLLTPDDFYQEAHRHIFEAFSALADAARGVDIVTLRDELARAGRLESVGGTAYLMEIGDFVPTAANLAHYAAIVRSRATSRRLIESLSGIVARTYAGAEEPIALLDTAESALLAIRAVAAPGTASGAADTCQAVQTLVSAELDAIERRGSEGVDGVPVTGIPTGFRALFYYLPIMKPGDLIVLAARPSVGKSALASCLGVNVAKAGKTVLEFSLEMSREQLAQRILTAESRVDSRGVRTGKLAEGDWEKLSSGADRLWGGKYFIDDNAGATLAYIRSRCRRVKSQHGLDFVIVDYLQLMSSPPAARGTRAAQNRNDEVSEFSRGLKLLAMELGIPVLALAQLSRQVERRDDKMPILSDLRDSGAIEQDADVVMFLHRKTPPQSESGSFAPDPDDAKQVGEIEVIIRKHRMGPTGMATLGFIPAYARFEDIADPGRF